MSHMLPDPEQLAAAIDGLGLRGAPCTFCKGEANGVHVFIPDEPWKCITAPPRPGKCRVVLAPLCSSCRGTEGLLEWIEDRIYERPIDAPVICLGDAS